MDGDEGGLGAEEPFGVVGSSDGGVVGEGVEEFAALLFTSRGGGTGLLAGLLEVRVGEELGEVGVEELVEGRGLGGRTEAGLTVVASVGSAGVLAGDFAVRAFA